MNGRLKNFLNSYEADDTESLKLEFRPVKTLDRLHRIFNELRDQKSETCGPYSLLKILRSLGLGDSKITEDSLALMSGTVISEEEHNISVRFSGKDENRMDEQIRQKYYSVPLSVSGQADELGTSVEGLVAATEATLGRRFAVIPIPSRTGQKTQFSRHNFALLTDMLWKHFPADSMHVIFNLQMDMLCSNRNMGSIIDIMDFLKSGKCRSRDEWNVGHFLIAGGIIRSTTASQSRRFYLLQDTYKSRGMGGYLIQPEERLRNALIRNDGKGGGILLLVPERLRKRILGEIEGFLATGLWNNGTPYVPPHF